jgi:hypothetical protein
MADDQESETKVEITEEVSIPSNALGMILFRRGKIKKFQLDFLTLLQRAYRAASIEHKLGDLLVRHRVITPGILNDALQIQSQTPHESVTAIVKAIQGELSDITEPARS